MMKKMSGGKMKKMMRGISGMNFPPGMHWYKKIKYDVSKNLHFPC
jgi:hypothetical protein